MEKKSIFQLKPYMAQRSYWVLWPESFQWNFSCLVHLDGQWKTLEATILYATQEPLSQGSYLCRKIGQGQSWVIIYINFVVLEYQTSYTKFQANLSAGSGEEDLFKDFTI